MKTNKLLTIFLLTLAMLLAGNFTYASTDDEIQKDLDDAADLYKMNKSDDNYKVVCTREAPVGTRIKRKVCRTVATAKQSRKDARRTMNKVRGSIRNLPPPN